MTRTKIFINKPDDMNLYLRDGHMLASLVAFLALRTVATPGDRRFFSRTKSEPHPKNAKEGACGCAGVYSIGWLASVSEEEDALGYLNSFTSINVANLYEMARNPGKPRLSKRKKPAKFPKEIKVGSETVTIFNPGLPAHCPEDHIASA